MPELRLAVYDRSGAEIPDVRDILSTFAGLEYTTGYPGGRSLTAQFDLPSDLVLANFIESAYQLRILSGTKIVWQGEIMPLRYRYNPPGLTVQAIGYWGSVLRRRTINKPWADTRISDDVWVWQTGTTGNGDVKTFLSRENKVLKFVPKAEAFANNDYAAVRYTAPTGQTVKKVSYTYELAEGAQAWEMSLYNVASAGTESGSSVTTSSFGLKSLTLGTPSQAVEFRFTSQAAQTPTSDGTYYARFYDVVVYTETSSINLGEIAADVAGALSGVISADTDAIGATSNNFGSFITHGQETFASLLERAAGLGDSSGNPWAVGLLPSDQATDDLPKLFAEQQPVLTGYDLIVDINSLDAAPEVVEGAENLYNWIAVEYTDSDGRRKFVTPDDDSSLKDTTSIAAYGQREFVLGAGRLDVAEATDAGKRFLAFSKDLRYYIGGPLIVKDFVYGSGGERIPAAEVYAGQRLRVADYIRDLTGAGGTFLVNQTRYRHEDGTLEMLLGVPDDLAVLLAVIAERSRQT